MANDSGTVEAIVRALFKSYHSLDWEGIKHCHQHDDDFFYVVANQGSKQQKQELQQLKTNF